MKEEKLEIVKELNADNKLILVDGSGYIFRAYYALPPMTNSEGIPINAAYGFTNMIIKLIEDFNPKNICVVFDFGKDTFRNLIYENYKANRSEPPEDLIPQFNLIKDAQGQLGCQQLKSKDLKLMT